VRARRLLARTPAGAHGSDAVGGIAAALGASFSDWEELPEQAILTLRTGLDAQLLVEQIADWLDATASR
jgi:hypothetical protein